MGKDVPEVKSNPHFHLEYGFRTRIFQEHVRQALIAK